MRVYPSIRASLVDHRIVSSSSSYDHNNMHLMIDRSYRYIEVQARSQVSQIFSFRRYIYYRIKSLNEEASHSQPLSTSREEGRGQRRSKLVVPKAKKLSSDLPSLHMSGSNRLIQGRGVGLGTSAQNLQSLICFPLPSLF